MFRFPNPLRDFTISRFLEYASSRFHDAAILRFRDSAIPISRFRDFAISVSQFCDSPLGQGYAPIPCDPRSTVILIGNRSRHAVRSDAANSNANRPSVGFPHFRLLLVPHFRLLSSLTGGNIFLTVLTSWRANPHL